MRHAVLALAASAFALTACGEGVVGKSEVSESEVRNEMAQAQTMVPGQYEAAVEFLRFDIPGMPAAALAEVRQQMESDTSVKSSYCLTEAEAARSQQDRLREMSKAQGDCAFERFDVDGEAIDGRLACSAMPGGGTATLTMTGTMGREASSVRIATQMSNPAVPGANATVEMKIDTRRTGDCTAASRAAAEAQSRATREAPSAP